MVTVHAVYDSNEDVYGDVESLQKQYSAIVNTWNHNALDGVTHPELLFVVFLGKEPWKSACFESCHRLVKWCFDSSSVSHSHDHESSCVRFVWIGFHAECDLDPNDVRATSPNERVWKTWLQNGWVVRSPDMMRELTRQHQYEALQRRVRIWFRLDRPDLARAEWDRKTTASTNPCFRGLWKTRLLVCPETIPDALMTSNHLCGDGLELLNTYVAHAYYPDYDRWKTLAHIVPSFLLHAHILEIVGSYLGIRDERTEAIDFRIVCLERRKRHHWPIVLEQCRSISVKPIYVMAYDGPRLHPGDNRASLPRIFARSGLSLGAIGCWMSHLQEMCRFAREAGNDHEWMFVGESDFYFGKTAGRDLDMLRHALPMLRSSPYDLVWCGYHTVRHSRWFHMYNWKPRRFLPLANQQKHSHHIGGTFGYWINKRGCMRYYSEFLRLESHGLLVQPMNLGIDRWMMETFCEHQLVLDSPIVFSEYFNDLGVKSDCA